MDSKNLNKKVILTQAQFDARATAGTLAEGVEYEITDAKISESELATALKTKINNKSTVSGTNDGTNWTSVTIDGTTKVIPSNTTYSSGNGITVGTDNKINANVYESKEAASSGTDLSLVTTGEKYTWNSKSAVSVSDTGSATDEISYITIDGTEKKIAGGSSVTISSTGVTDGTNTYNAADKLTVSDEIVSSAFSGVTYGTGNVFTYSYMQAYPWNYFVKGSENYLITSGPYNSTYQYFCTSTNSTSTIFNTTNLNSVGTLGFNSEPCYDSMHNNYILVRDNTNDDDESEGVMVIYKGTSRWTRKIVSSTVQGTWTWAVYGNGMILAVTNSSGTNYAMYSTDGGLTWSDTTWTYSGYLFGVYYANDKFYIRAGTTSYYYSTDCLNWTSSSFSSANTVYDIIYGNNMYMASTDQFTRKVFTSTDGITWSSVTHGLQLTQLMFCKNRFILYDISSGVISLSYSTDGTTWSDIQTVDCELYANITTDGEYIYCAGRTTSSTTANPVYKVNYFTLKHKYDIKQNNTSKVDDLTLSIVPTNISYFVNDSGYKDASYHDSQKQNALKIGNGLNITRGDTSDDISVSKYINISATGEASYIFDKTFNSSLSCIAVAASSSGTYVAVPMSGTKLLYSSDLGLTWSENTVSSYYLGYGALTYANSKFTAMVISNSGSDNGYYRSLNSTDGITWTETSQSFTISTATLIRSIAYGNDIYVGVGYASSTTKVTTYITSTDGLTWTTGTLPVSGIWRFVTYVNNTFIILQDVASNTFLYSTDGLTWTTGTLPASIIWGCVKYINSKFIFTSSGDLGGEIAYSTDLINFTEISAGIKSRNISYIGNHYYIVDNANAESTKLYSSSDLLTWTYEPICNSSVTGVMYSTEYVNNQLLFSENSSKYLIVKFASDNIITKNGENMNSIIRNAILNAPTTAGTYKLQCVVDSSGNPTFSWVSD